MLSRLRAMWIFGVVFRFMRETVLFSVFGKKKTNDPSKMTLREETRTEDRDEKRRENSTLH
jgi:hypothetical protein